MTTTADQRGWGNPRSATFESTIRAACIVVAAGGISVRLHSAVSDIFRYLNTGLAEHYHLAGYADDYGLAIRPIRGYEQQWAATHDPKYLSNHSYGLAEDLDSSINPMTSDLKAQHEFIRAVVDPLLAHFDGRLVWGGEYSTARKDYMHFEYIGTKAQAAADSALARRLLEPVRAHTTTPPQPLGAKMLFLLSYKGRHYVTDGFQKRLVTPTFEKALVAAGVKYLTLADADAAALPGSE